MSTCTRVDPRGLSQFSGLTDVSATSDYPQLEYGTFRGALRELRLSQETLLSLSDETGGLAIVNTGDVVGGLGRIVLDNSRYYLLGYHSDSSKWSRRFLKIDVRVKRPDLRVRARRGFLPPDPKATARAARESGIGSAASPALKAALSRAGARRRSASPRICGAFQSIGLERLRARSPSRSTADP